MTPFWFYTKCLICIASSVWLFLWLYGKVHITILSFDKICCQRFLVQLLCKLAHQQFLLSALFEKNINIEEYCAEYNCYITAVWTYSYSKKPPQTYKITIFCYTLHDTSPLKVPGCLNLLWKSLQSENNEVLNLGSQPD